MWNLQIGYEDLVWAYHFLGGQALIIICFVCDLFVLRHLGSKPTFGARQLSQGKEKSNDRRTVSRKYQENRLIEGPLCHIALTWTTVRF